MKLILTGTASPECDTKNVEIGGKPMLRILGPMKTTSGEILPVTVWGETKCGYWKKFIENGETFSIVVELQARPQTYTNHEGETVTVPNVQLKLYSFLNVPQMQKPTAHDSFVAGSTNLHPHAANSTLPPPPQNSAQSFYFAPPPQPHQEKVKPWPTNNGIEQHETWGTVF